MADYLPPPYGKSYDELMKEYPYAPATREKAIADAKKLMADAGYANGIAKTFNFVVRESPQNRQLAAYAQAEWERLLGVKTKLEVVQVSAMVDRQVAGTFDIISHATCLGGRRPERHHPGVLQRQQDHGQEVRQQLHQLQERRVRQDPDQFSVEVDPQKKLQLGRQLNQILNNEMPNTGVTPRTVERTAGTTT